MRGALASVLLVLLVVSCAPAAGPASAPGAAAARPAVPPAPAPAAAAPTGRGAYPAAGDPAVRLRGAWCAPTGAQSPLWAAKQSGIFARHRLDVEVVYVQGSDANLAALLRGETDFLDCSAS